MEKQDKRTVIFFDRCVPCTLVNQVIIPYTKEFADHFFASDEFAERVVHNDRKLLSAVERRRRTRHENRLCIFVTCDSDFIKKERLKRHPAYNTTVKVVYGKNVSDVSDEEVRVERMLAIVRKIVDFYNDFLKERRE